MKVMTEVISKTIRHIVHGKNKIEMKMGVVWNIFYHSCYLV
jgi:hypothetical protein